MNKKPLIYLDMDQVLVNFNSSKAIPLHEKHVYNHPAIYNKGFFIDLEPMPGAINFVNKLIGLNTYDIHILTQPVAGSPDSYSEKAAWIAQYLPLLVNKITMTQNKLLLKGEFLIDDNIKWKSFEGLFLFFDSDFPEEEFDNLFKFLSLR